MPGKHVTGITEGCRRCEDNPAVLVVRTEPLCRDCFIKYVHTKAIKRMESFRVRNAAPDQQRKLLLPISFGVSSVTLLHILDQHLQTQKAKTGRTGFKLSVFFVDTSSVEPSTPSKDVLTLVQERYPDHQYATSSLDSIFTLVPDTDPLSTLVPTSLEERLLPPSERLSSLMNSLRSSTAHADVTSTLKTRLVVEHAKSMGCEGILWGDSTTKLAEKTLAQTAKGRGFSLPWQISDGESPLGITFNYPLRDVLKKELVSYANFSEPSLSTLIYETSASASFASMSSKTTTIDDLMKQYFESVEENFPSIVANVVRTTSKLETAPGSVSEPRCTLCSMPVTSGRFGIHGWGGDQQDGVQSSTGDSFQSLCYGCTRSIPVPR